jgi:hypothetical protein
LFLLEINKNYTDTCFCLSVYGNIFEIPIVPFPDFVGVYCGLSGGLTTAEISNKK